MQVAIKSDVGQRRTVNEDAAGYFLSQTHLPLLVVCDGIGGHNAGDVASALALSYLGDRWNETAFTEIEDAYQWLIQTIQEANDAIFQQSQEYDDLNGMGTTLVAGVIVADQLLIANVGDSRAYLLRDNQLKQLTEDQSLVNMLLKSGEITPEEATNHPSKHVVTQSLGVTLNVDVDYVRAALRQGDQLLLCSDGLTDMLDAPAIQDVLAQTTNVDEQVDHIIEAANQAGGRDNITALIAQITVDEEGMVC